MSDYTKFDTQTHTPETEKEKEKSTRARRGTKHYGIYIKDKSIQDKLDNMPSVGEFLRGLVTDYFSGKIVASDNIDYRIKQAKLQNLELKNVNEKINHSTNQMKIKKLAASTRLDEIRANSLQHLGSLPSPSGMRMLEDAIVPTEIANANTRVPEVCEDGENSYVQCTECGLDILYDGTDPKAVVGAKEKYVDHVFQRHKRDLTTAESARLKRL